MQKDYEGVQMKSSREQFEEWYMENWGHTEDHHETMFERDPDSPEDYYRLGVRLAHHSWQASRAVLKIDNTPAYWMTFYPCELGEEERKHSHSGPESCARRIANEIGGYVIPVYYGEKS